MSLRAGLALAAFVAGMTARAAWAQDGEEGSGPPPAEAAPAVPEPAAESPVAATPAVPVTAAPEAAPADDEAPVDPVAKQEVGARIGAQIGFPDVTPGGFRLGGIYLYKLDEQVWFDGEAVAVIGSGARECYLARTGELACEHAGFDGFAMQISGGVRYFLERRPSGFHPYGRAGAGLAYAGFGDDGVTGVALYGYGGGGARFRVAPRIAVSGEALLILGPGLYDSDLGLQLFGGLVVQLGVEFAL